MPKTDQDKLNSRKKGAYNPVFLNNLIAYGSLILGFGSYLLIILTEKDFTPSRITLALNACSGIMFFATGQITATNVRSNNRNF